MTAAPVVAPAGHVPASTCRSGYGPERRHRRARAGRRQLSPDDRHRALAGTGGLPAGGRLPALALLCREVAPCRRGVGPSPARGCRLRPGTARVLGGAPGHRRDLSRERARDHAPLRGAGAAAATAAGGDARSALGRHLRRQDGPARCRRAGRRTLSGLDGGAGRRRAAAGDGAGRLSLRGQARGGRAPTVRREGPDPARRRRPRGAAAGMARGWRRAARATLCRRPAAQSAPGRQGRPPPALPRHGEPAHAAAQRLGPDRVLGLGADAAGHARMVRQAARGHRLYRDRLPAVPGRPGAAARWPSSS